MRLLALLAAGLFTGPLLAEDKKKDEDAILGKWQFTKLDFGPDTPADSVKDVEKGFFTFSAEKIVVQFPGVKQPKEGTYALDATAKPKAIDIKAEGDEAKRLYIYEIDGDTLRMTVTSGSNKVRPTKLEPDSKSGVAIITLKRVKEEKKEK